MTTFVTNNRNLFIYLQYVYTFLSCVLFKFSKLWNIRKYYEDKEYGKLLQKCINLSDSKLSFVFKSDCIKLLREISICFCFSCSNSLRSKICYWKPFEKKTIKNETLKLNMHIHIFVLMGQICYSLLNWIVIITIGWLHHQLKSRNCDVFDEVVYIFKNADPTIPSFIYEWLSF